MTHRRALTLLAERFAVCRFAPDEPLPAWVFHAGASTWSLTRTSHELSLVCPEDDLPPSVGTAERAWRALVVDGPIPFGETGVIAGLSAPLAAAGVPMFVLSTFDTDLVLVKDADLARARAALAAAGHEVRG